MTIKEANEFYKKDTREYELNKSKEFITWFNKVYDEKNSYLNINEIQELINKIINWYELKFPNRQLELEDGIINKRFESIESISDYLTFEQLLFRLSHGEIETINCNYRTSSGYCVPYNDYNNSNNIIRWKNFVCLEIKFKNNLVWLAAEENGIVKQNDLENIIGEVNEPVTLEQLYETLVKMNYSNCDYSELDKCNKLHKNDLILRSKMFDAVVKGLIYSRKTIPEYGFKRAEYFTNEINKENKNNDLTDNTIKVLR